MGRIQLPTATRFIATIEDLIDVLDYSSDDIDGMDDDAGEEEAQDPPFTGRWTATSSYDVCMVDALKENNGDDKENLVENKPPETQPKYRRPKRRTESHRSNAGIGENGTPDDAENNEDPVGARSKQEEQENGQASPDEQALSSDKSEDDNYLRSPKTR